MRVVLPLVLPRVRRQNLAELCPAGRGDRSGLLVGGRPPLLAPSRSTSASRRWPSRAARHAASHAGVVHPATPSAAARPRWPNRPRRSSTSPGGRFILGVGVGSHADRVRPGRGRLPPAGPPDGRRHRRRCSEAWAAPMGTERPRHPLSPDSRRRPGCRCGSAARVRRPAGGLPPWATAGSPSSSPPTTTGRPSRRCARRPKRPGATPTPSSRRWCLRPCRPRRRGPAHGAQWLSDMYGLPPKAFERHLVAGEPETCAAALGRYVEAGARHIVVMVAGTGAVRHFELAASAFVARSDAVPVGVCG